MFWKNSNAQLRADLFEKIRELESKVNTKIVDGDKVLQEQIDELNKK